MARTLVWNAVKWQLWCVLVALWPTAQGALYEPKRYAVQVSATIQESPPKITLTWPGDPANNYQISKRTLSSGWQVLANLGGSATSFQDSNVQAGIPYEYRIVKDLGNEQIGYGYIQAAIKAPLVDNRGRVILVVENSMAGALGGELNNLQQDLIGDGWTVSRANVSAGDSPSQVKNVIRNVYNSDPATTKAVILVGHVPVPYSGQIFPDGHENHEGAWPADVFYGEMTSQWTDSTVDYARAERDVNWNRPGDGKFDQGKIPSEVELAVGRIDFSAMTCFANKNPSRSETDLTRAYLNRNRAWRHGQLQVPRRGIICDNFSDKGEDPIAGSAWRNFPTFFGAGNITEVGWDQYLPNATQNSYLWSYASGGGSYYYSMGVAHSDDFALRDVKVIFSMYMGSYFGDWNNESNFMRAALGSGTTLTVTYSGFPQYLYFPMALGGTVGDSLKLSQNNFTNTVYAPWAQGWSEVHMSLLGDPTLRMHPVLPPSNLSLRAEPGKAVLNWSASGDSSLVGYHLYRAANAQGPFTRVTASPLNATTHNDLTAAGSYTYMVRAIKLEQSGSGSYFNASQGILGSVTITGGTTVQPPAVPANFTARLQNNQAVLTWNGVSGADGYQVEYTVNNGRWFELGSYSASQTSANSATLAEGNTYSYRLRAFNAAGFSAYTGVQNLTVAPTVQPPGVPTNFRAGTVTHNSITVQWNAVASATDYELGYRKASVSSATYTTLGTATTFTLSNAAAQTEYVFHVRSKNSAGASAFSDELRLTTAAPPVPAASVNFVAFQTQGGGNWPSSFGADGAIIAGGLNSPASYATAAAPASPHVWSYPTSDPRGLYEDATAGRRVGAAWYGNDINIPLNISGGAAKDVTLYLVDWDRVGRKVRIELIDTATGLILDTRQLDNLAEGIYVRYAVKGSVRVRVVREAGPNAVLSGLFFGTKAAPINDPVRLSLRRAGGQLDLTVTGSTGQAFVVEKSSDFQSWSQVTTGQLSTTSTTLQIPWSANPGFTALRVRSQ